MAKILLTGFEAFGGDHHNPSAAVAAQLQATWHGAHQVVSAQLAVDGVKAPKRLDQLMRQHQPQAVLMLGLASGRLQIALERLAINRLEYRIPDNAGRTCQGPIVKGGADAIFSSLPLDAILRSWHQANIPAYISDSAGTYLCNQVFYLMRHHHPNVMAGFLHLPNDQTIAKQRLAAYVQLEQQQDAVHLALTVISEHLNNRRS